jgi:hypothetical protein
VESLKSPFSGFPRFFWRNKPIILSGGRVFQAYAVEEKQGGRQVSANLSDLDYGVEVRRWFNDWLR